MSKNLYYEGFHDNSNILYANSDIGNSGIISNHFHRCVEIIYITKGNCEYFVNGENFIAEKDDILFIKRCDIHAFKYHNTDSVLLVIGLKYSKDFDMIFQNKAIPPILKDKSFNQTILPFFQTLAKHEENSDMVIKGYINIIIGKLFEHYPNRKIENSANMDIIIKVLNYIDEHYKEPITLESISNEFGYNKYYFSRLFNLSIGQNLNTYLNGVRLSNLISDAKKLEKPNFSELILDYGFESFSTFYRTCYNLYKTSPKNLLKNENLV